MKSRIWNSWIHRTGLCVGFLLLFSFILTPLAPAVSFPDYSPSAGAVSLDYPLLKNGQVLHEEIAGFEWTDTPTGPAAYRVKVWQEDTPRVDENAPAKTVMAPERAWSSPIWVEK